MKSERLYTKDAYLTTFDCKITRTSPRKDGRYEIVLDRTAFYPESGGQPADEGRINGVFVVDVIEGNDEILHIVETEINRDSAECQVDWSKRFEHMQQHSGQHVLSACFAELLNGKTDSFHIGGESSTIEIDVPSIDENAIARVEDLANHYVHLNLPIKSYIVHSNELQNLPLRKQPKVAENIRIVQTGDVDFSPCGGTHVRNTGEIGLIKIKRVEKLKSSCKIEFVCGMRALADYRDKNTAIYAIGAMLSVRDNEVLSNVTKLHNEYRALSKQYSLVKNELLCYEAEKIYLEGKAINGITLVCKVFESVSIEDLKTIAQALTQKSSTLALLAAKNESLQVVFYRSEDVSLDMGALLKANLPIIEGRGGGSAKAAQGGGIRVDKALELLTACESQITAFLEN